ncbi:MAG: RIP metalloprotease RseP, partial [Planctomycetota bacterium]
YLFALLVLSLLFVFFGQPFTPAVVGQVQPESAAAEAGLLPGDRIVRIDGKRIERFEDVRQIVSMNPEVPLEITVERAGAPVTVIARPHRTVITDNFGNRHEIGLLGVSRQGIEFVRHDPLTALWRSVDETAMITAATLKAIGQMIAGTRTTEELGGPLRIAKMSGQMAQGGVYSFLWFMGVLSLHLGLINLFPVPLLDGGHLLFYGIEAVRGKPLGERAQEYGFRIGLALVLTLMLFVTWNDLVNLKVVEFIRELVT